MDEIKDISNYDSDETLGGKLGKTHISEKNKREKNNPVSLMSFLCGDKARVQGIFILMQQLHKALLRLKTEAIPLLNHDR